MHACLSVTTHDSQLSQPRVSFAVLDGDGEWPRLAQIWQAPAGRQYTMAVGSCRPQRPAELPVYVPEGIDFDKEVPLLEAQGAHFQHCTGGRTIACSYVPAIATRVQDLASIARRDAVVGIAPGNVEVKVCFNAEQLVSTSV